VWGVGGDHVTAVEAGVLAGDREAQPAAAVAGATGVGLPESFEG
jgi:hypothetical protein